VLRIPYEELERTVAAALGALGFEPQRALRCARLFAETTRDGVYTHGMNRFPRFMRMIRAGRIDIHAAPELVASRGGLERWDGKRGAGNLNAQHAMGRAIALASQHGIGAVALAYTNHWMRAGSYGWQAAEDKYPAEHAAVGLGRDSPGQQSDCIRSAPAARARGV